MTVFGICMARDEADIVATTVRHMLEQVDHVIVSDNNSTDGTREILAELDCTIVDDPEVGYYQSRKMTELAVMAGELGATWVVPFDADEWWYAPFGDNLAQFIAESADQWLCVKADLYDHVATGSDPDKPDPIDRIGWRRRDPAPLAKVACRVRRDLVINQGNHSASYDGGATERPGLVIRHFPYRSPQQFVRKAINGAQAYAATDLPDDAGAHWRQYGQLIDQGGPEVGEDIFRRWFWVAHPDDDPTLIYDPAP
jgi:hypothetical protein